MASTSFPRQAATLALLALAGCGGTSPKPAEKPSHAELVAHESELLKLTLTREAQARLGIRTVKAGQQAATQTRRANGEIVVPPGSDSALPAGSTTNLAQLAAQQIAADAEVERAQAQARLARIAFDRAEGLVREEAGSVRARDEAAGALAAAQAALGAAREQRRLLGPATATMGRLRTAWVRVPLFGSDIPAVRRGGGAMVRPLGAENAPPRAARAMPAPPSANAVAGTVDLFFAIDNRDQAYRVGQRVAVDLPLGTTGNSLSVPNAAILRDIYGGEWVYRRTGPDSFIRQRVETSGMAGTSALIARGLALDAEVVTDGAAELFGTEFGVAH